MNRLDNRWDLIHPVTNKSTFFGYCFGEIWWQDEWWY